MSDCKVQKTKHVSAMRSIIGESFEMLFATEDFELVKTCEICQVGLMS